MKNKNSRLNRLLLALPRSLARRRGSESGQAMVEYVVLAAAFGLIAVVIAQQFITADAVTNYFNNTGEVFSNMVEQVYISNAASPPPTPPWDN